MLISVIQEEALDYININLAPVSTCLLMIIFTFNINQTWKVDVEVEVRSSPLLSSAAFHMD